MRPVDAPAAEDDVDMIAAADVVVDGEVDVVGDEMTADCDAAAGETSVRWDDDDFFAGAGAEVDRAYLRMSLRRQFRDTFAVVGVVSAKTSAVSIDVVFGIVVDDVVDG